MSSENECPPAKDDEVPIDGDEFYFKNRR